MLGRITKALDRFLGFEARRERRERRVLRRMCLGDEAAVERTVSGERSRNPGITEGEAVRRAIRRLRRDNR